MTGEAGPAAAKRAFDPVARARALPEASLNDGTRLFVRAGDTFTQLAPVLEAGGEAADAPQYAAALRTLIGTLVATAAIVAPPTASLRRGIFGPAGAAEGAAGQPAASRGGPLSWRLFQLTVRCRTGMHRRTSPARHAAAAPRLHGLIIGRIGRVVGRRTGSVPVSWGDGNRHARACACEKPKAPPGGSARARADGSACLGAAQDGTCRCGSRRRRR